MDPNWLLADPDLAPFAPLAAVGDTDRAAVLLRVLNLIAAVTDDAVRDALGRVAVTLAGVRLDASTIDATWEESAMPIRSILDERFEQGLEQGLEQMTVSLLLAKFGDDDHLIELARSLLPLGPEQIVERVNAAGTLDDLT